MYAKSNLADLMHSEGHFNIKILFLQTEKSSLWRTRWYRHLMIFIMATPTLEQTLYLNRAQIYRYKFAWRIRMWDACWLQSREIHQYHGWWCPGSGKSQVISSYWQSGINRPWRINRDAECVNWNLGNKLQWNLKGKSYIFIQENAFENVVGEIVAFLSWPQCVDGIRNTGSITTNKQLIYWGLD